LHGDDVPLYAGIESNGFSVVLCTRDFELLKVSIHHTERDIHDVLGWELLGLDILRQVQHDGFQEPLLLGLESLIVVFQPNLPVSLLLRLVFFTIIPVFV
jgi:hypothetical protein